MINNHDNNPMQFHPLVSIIIPVYNGANYLQEAIDSALAQTYSNIEIIVVNDGSTDDGKTEAIALKYEDKIHYYSKENGGCGSALNYAISKMKGEYFSWLSHDDLYEPEKIEHQINLLNKLDNKNTIIYGAYKVVDQNARLVSIVDPATKLNISKLNIALMPLMRGLIHGCTLLIPTECFKEAGVFNEKLLCTQDYDLWFDFLKQYPIHYDGNALVKSRQHPEQSTHVIPSMVEEGNQLWCRFLNELTNDQMEAMSGSASAFFHQTANFLSTTPYNEAEILARDKAKQTYEDIKVTVIIPVYNRQELAMEAVQSVYNQTYQNLEIIVIDDGSEQDLSKLKSLLKQDARVKFVQQSNKGPGAARNKAIEMATGQYIAFLDSDDLFLPEKIEIQLRYCIKNNLEFVHTSYKKHTLDNKYISDVDTNSLQGNAAFPKLIASCTIALPTVIVSTHLLKENKFITNITKGEDVCLWIKLASIIKLGAINDCLSIIRVGDTTTSSQNQSLSQGIINILQYVIHDEYLAQFTAEIKSLMYGLFSLRDFTSKSIPVMQKDAHPLHKLVLSLIKKALFSYKVFGFRHTMSRIGKWCNKVLSKS